VEEIEKPKEEDEEIDFDFSIYDAEEQETEVVESLANLSKARITGLRSRYSNWARELERLANLEDDITKVSIEVASFVQDISTLWNFYGMLHAYWERIRTIFGTVISDDVIRIKKNCKRLLESYNDRAIPHKVHNNLLYLESVLITLKQRVGLGFETEKAQRGIYARAKRSIVE